MNQKGKIALAVTVAALAVLGLMVMVLRSSSANYWVTPAEYKAQAGTAGEPARVAGRIVNNSMDWDKVNRQLVFKIRAKGEKVTLPVVYQGFVPDTLVNQSHVLVEGSMSGESFSARTLLVRCPEDYLAEQAVGEAFRALKIEGSLYR